MPGVDALPVPVGARHIPPGRPGSSAPQHPVDHLAVVAPAATPARLRPSPTRHAVVGLRLSSRLAQGPAVRVADRHHSLRLDMLAKTRSAFLQVRCTVVALWSEHEAAYATWIRPATTKLDSFLPTSSAPASLVRRWSGGHAPGPPAQPSGGSGPRRPCPGRAGRPAHVSCP